MLLRLCGLLTTHLDYRPIGLYPGGLKSQLNFALENQSRPIFGWAYIRVGFYSGFYSMLFELEVLEIFNRAFFIKNHLVKNNLKLFLGLSQVEVGHLTLPPNIFSAQVKSRACFITVSGLRVQNKIKET